MKSKSLTITAVSDNKDLAINGAKLAGSALAGSAAGALAGKFSPLVSIPLLVYGIKKGNLLVVAGSLGMLAGSNYKSQGISGMGSIEEIYGFEGGLQGFSFQSMIAGAKQRLTNWLTINKSKVAFLPAKSAAPKTNGIGETEMPGMGDTDLYLNSLGQSEFVIGDTDEMIGETTEMTIADMGNVRADNDGSALLGTDAMGRIL